MSQDSRAEFQWWWAFAVTIVLGTQPREPKEPWLHARDLRFLCESMVRYNRLQKPLEVSRQKACWIDFQLLAISNQLSLDQTSRMA